MKIDRGVPTRGARAVSGVLYNEIEPYAAAWLANLARGGHIARGPVDTRSIAELQPEDVRGLTQFHAFAGIGVWSHALRLAGVPDDFPVWTGSCPCQPFSQAGARRGRDDERHLWPAWYALIRECRPAVVLGEQVASPDGLDWLDHVLADLEDAGYAVGAADLCAAGIGAPHLRQRLYFVGVADTVRAGRPERGALARHGSASGRSSASPRLGHAGGDRDREHARELPRHEGEHGERGAHRDHTPLAPGAARDPDAPGAVADHDEDRWAVERAARLHAEGQPGHDAARRGPDGSKPGPVNGFWADAEWLYHQDGCFRPVEPGSFPLADGTAGRVVCVCADCGTETTFGEDLRYVRRLDRCTEGLYPAEVLLTRLHGASLHAGAYDAGGGALPGAALLQGGALRTLWHLGQPAQAPQELRRHGQQRDQHRDPVRGLPQLRAQETLAGVDVHRLWHDVHREIASEAREDLFCSVCLRVRPHLCTTAVVRRSGLLRAYGNAIVAPLAATFIRAALDL